ncbi:MAG: proton-conducting transporter membrane subunit [Thermodesulfobacteriota bacterium]
MGLLVLGLALLLGSALAALLLAGSERASGIVGAVGGVAGCVVAVVPALRVLHGAELPLLEAPWDVPYGSLALGIDPLSALFLLPLFAIGCLAAVYGREYLAAYRGRKRLAVPTAALNVFLASMATVVSARSVVLFLVAWEVMTLASYVLVTLEHEAADVRRAGWVYLLAGHACVACLLLLFLLLGREAGSLDFAAFARATPSAGASALLFALAALGFGIKAGFVPVHVWLPEAHAAAPSHVSALMSGVLVKLGIYGFLRVLGFLPRAAWWGPLLIALGLAGALVGIALALQQRDLKRVLAYSTIENVGVVLLGIGVGWWGTTRGDARLAALGMAGGLLHLWNHALMKSLMFFAAGSVLHGTGTKDLERLGGLMKAMPWTGCAMLLGAVAISALPPLNGFLGEWLIYLALIGGGTAPHGVAALLLVGVLSLVGGLAAVCFVRLAGVTLLGAPRSSGAAHAHEASRWMVAPTWVLAAACVAVALLPAPVLALLSPVGDQLVGPGGAGLDVAAGALSTVASCNLALWACLATLAVLLAASLRRRTTRETTWDCGYAAPTPRMQYTARSFSEMLGDRLLPATLRARARRTTPQGVFPAPATYSTECVDPLTRAVYEPFFARCAARFARLRWLQQGVLQVYVLYVVAVVVLALTWTAFRGWMLR